MENLFLLLYSARRNLSGQVRVGELSRSGRLQSTDIRRSGRSGCRRVGMSGIYRRENKERKPRGLVLKRVVFCFGVNAQVTASSFDAQDALTSDPARLVVRGMR